MRPAEVAGVLGISITTLYRREKQEDFPKKIKISENAVGWRASSINRFIEDKSKQQEK